MYICASGIFCDYIPATGKHNNRWNLITYRMALAVYCRSPAAYDALKTFSILQLPCKSSLKDFLSESKAEPGVNEQKIAEQRFVYEAFKEQKVKEGKKKPQSKGVLIFDEVKVQSKVCPCACTSSIKFA